MANPVKNEHVYKLGTFLKMWINNGAKYNDLYIKSVKKMPKFEVYVLYPVDEFEEHMYASQYDMLFSDRSNFWQSFFPDYAGTKNALLSMTGAMEGQDEEREIDAATAHKIICLLQKDKLTYLNQVLRSDFLHDTR